MDSDHNDIVIQSSVSDGQKSHISKDVSSMGI